MRGCGSGRGLRVSGIDALYLTQSSTQGANVIHKLIGVAADVACIFILAWMFLLVYVATVPDEVVRWLQRL